MAKEVAGLIKLQIKGGAANPSPPVGPALGEGFAAPPLICNLINPATSLAISVVIN